MKEHKKHTANDIFVDLQQELLFCYFFFLLNWVSCAYRLEILSTILESQWMDLETMNDSYECYEKENFVQTCHCGALFKVIVSGQIGHEELEEYYCPECNQEYIIRASNTPFTKLITSRTDGK